MAEANVWQSLVGAALVGTERQPDAPLQAPGAIGEFLAQLPEGRGEANLLAKAATLSLYRKAGQQGLRVSVPPATVCAVDDSPLCPPRARPYLQRMLAGEMSALLPEWLRLAAQVGWRVPERLLPGLLTLGQKQRELRELVLPVLGKRGVWLAGQNPDWAYAMDAGNETVWQTGTRSERIQYLRNIRRQHPAIAREQLAATIAQEAARDRAVFLQTLETGLSHEDMPFLESMLNDRAQDVRQVAVNLLTQLPNSRICHQASLALQTLVQVDRDAAGRRNVEILPLSSLSTGLPQAVIEQPIPGKMWGQSALQLARLISCAPLDLWPHQFGLTVAELVECSAQSEWREAIVTGLILATLNQSNTAVAEALLKVIPDQDDQATNLLRLLDVTQANRLIRQLQERGQQERVGQLLRGCPYAWDEAVTQIAIDLIAQHIQSNSIDWSIGSWLAGTVASCCYLPAQATIQRLEQLEVAEHYLSRAIKQLCQMLQFRQQMLQALQPDSG